MLLLRDWTSFPPRFRGTTLCIGNFDGVHLGHAQMLATGRRMATARSVPFTILTFDPHPVTVLKPDVPRRPLTTPTQRQTLLAGYDPDVLLIVDPTREFLSITAGAFLTDIVQGTADRGLHASLLVEGPTFSFGRGAKGNVHTLQASGAAHGFETVVVPTQAQALADFTLANVSSSLIRWLIQHGRVADAARCLGRPYTLAGTVVHGAKRGKAIGFPTANIETTQLVPAPGIYAGQATIDGRTHTAAISVGDNPTFGPGPITVEAFLLDFDGDLYGKPLELAFHFWVREMLPFAGAPPLVAQMHRDVTLTRVMMSSPILATGA